MQQFPVGLDVSWMLASQCVDLNESQQKWLVDTGSLTERIQSMCTEFRVELIGQGIAPLHANECQLLPLPDSYYEVREVILLADQQPWVFARSVIPSRLLQGEWQSLGNSPLGKQLFNDKRFVRGEFEIASLPASDIDGLWGDVSQPNSAKTLFARRSAFHFAAQDILVAEVFLPQSPLYQQKGKG